MKHLFIIGIIILLFILLAIYYKKNNIIEGNEGKKEEGKKEDNIKKQEVKRADDTNEKLDEELPDLCKKWNSAYWEKSSCKGLPEGSFIKNCNLLAECVKEDGKDELQMKWVADRPGQNLSNYDEYSKKKSTVIGQCKDYQVDFNRDQNCWGKKGSNPIYSLPYTDKQLFYTRCLDLSHPWHVNKGGWDLSEARPSEENCINLMNNFYDIGDDRGEDTGWEKNRKYPSWWPKYGYSRQKSLHSMGDPVTHPNPNGGRIRCTEKEGQGRGWPAYEGAPEKYKKNTVGMSMARCGLIKSWDTDDKKGSDYRGNKNTTIRRHGEKSIGPARQSVTGKDSMGNDTKTWKTYTELSNLNGPKKCINWSNEDKKKWPTAGLENNFCRNPDGKPLGPWCYTKENDGKEKDDKGNRIWDYCYLSPDELHYKNATKDIWEDGRDYRGNLNKSMTGLECLSWDPLTDKNPWRNENNPKAKDVIQGVAYNYLIDGDPNKPDKCTLKKKGLMDNADKYNNYCRNPDEVEFAPWCYTSDPNKKGIRWQYCLPGWKKNSDSNNLNSNLKCVPLNNENLDNSGCILYDQKPSSEYGDNKITENIASAWYSSCKNSSECNGISVSSQDNKHKICFKNCNIVDGGGSNSFKGETNLIKNSLYHKIKMPDAVVTANSKNKQYPSSELTLDNINFSPGPEGRVKNAKILKKTQMNFEAIVASDATPSKAQLLGNSENYSTLDGCDILDRKSVTLSKLNACNKNASDEEINNTNAQYFIIKILEKTDPLIKFVFENVCLSLPSQTCWMDNFKKNLLLDYSSEDNKCSGMTDWYMENKSNSDMNKIYDNQGLSGGPRASKIVKRSIDKIKLLIENKEDGIDVTTFVDNLYNLWLGAKGKNNSDCDTLIQSTTAPIQSMYTEDPGNGNNEWNYVIDMSDPDTSDESVAAVYKIILFYLRKSELINAEVWDTDVDNYQLFNNVLSSNNDKLDWTGPQGMAAWRNQKPWKIRANIRNPRPGEGCSMDAAAEGTSAGGGAAAPGAVVGAGASGATVDSGGAVGDNASAPANDAPVGVSNDATSAPVSGGVANGDNNSSLQYIHRPINVQKELDININILNNNLNDPEKKQNTLENINYLIPILKPILIWESVYTGFYAKKLLINDSTSSYSGIPSNSIKNINDLCQTLGVNCENQTSAPATAAAPTPTSEAFTNRIYKKSIIEGLVSKKGGDGEEDYEMAKKTLKLLGDETFSKKSGGQYTNDENDPHNNPSNPIATANICSPYTFKTPPVAVEYLKDSWTKCKNSHNVGTPNAPSSDYTIQQDNTCVRDYIHKQRQIGKAIERSGIEAQCGFWTTDNDGNDNWQQGRVQNNPCNLYKNNILAQPLTNTSNGVATTTEPSTGIQTTTEPSTGIQTATTTPTSEAFTNRMFNTRIIEGMTSTLAPNDLDVCELNIYTYINPSCMKTEKEIKEQVEKETAEKITDTVVKDQKKQKICQDKMVKESLDKDKIAAMQREIIAIQKARLKCLSKKACKKNKSCPECPKNPECPTVEQKGDKYIVHNNKTAPQRDKFGNVRVICKNNNQNDDDEFITLGSGRDGIDGVSGVGVAGAAGAAGAAAKAQQIRKSILKAHISGKAGGCEI